MEQKMNFDNNEIFEKFGIINADKIDFQNFNIIIGENGSGKSRFLRAVKEYYKQPDKYSVVYAYCPNISTSYQPGHEQKLDIPLKKIIIDNASIDFEDFLKYIEIHGYPFLEELLYDITLSEKYASVSKDDKVIKLEQDIILIINTLLNRKISFSENKIRLIPPQKTEDDPEIKQERSVLLKDILPDFSPGELMLLYMAIFIMALKYLNKDKMLIIILDEPECHLHPKALVEFINFLKGTCTFEQCWIATHSIFILPLVKFNETIYIRNSVIQKRNRSYFENIFDSVVGNNEAIAQYLLSSWLFQYQDFVADCFILPQEVEKRNLNDEQLNKFLIFIQANKFRSNEPFSVLDYGGGKGRLGTFINEKKKQKGVHAIKYYIYDKYLPKEEQNPSFIYLSTLNKKSFDCVVMMNVFHEIDIMEWDTTFKEIHRILKPNGYLLLFDVITLARGEQPFGDTGFIFLGEKQMNELFRQTEIKSIDMKKGDKSNFFIITKQACGNITQETVQSALESLKDDVYVELDHYNSLRKKLAHSKKTTDQDNPRKYAFLSQHYINIHFALKNFTKK